MDGVGETGLAFLVALSLFVSLVVDVSTYVSLLHSTSEYLLWKVRMAVLSPQCSVPLGIEGCCVSAHDLRPLPRISS